MWGEARVSQVSVSRGVGDGDGFWRYRNKVRSWQVRVCVFVSSTEPFRVLGGQKLLQKRVLSVLKVCELIQRGKMERGADGPGCIEDMCEKWSKCHILWKLQKISPAVPEVVDEAPYDLHTLPRLPLSIAHTMRILLVSNYYLSRYDATKFPVNRSRVYRLCKVNVRKA